jgi:hypothetical protein
MWEVMQDKDMVNASLLLADEVHGHCGLTVVSPRQTFRKPVTENSQGGNGWFSKAVKKGLKGQKFKGTR